MLDIYHFLLTSEVKTPLVVDDHTGSALRGTMFEAVWNRFCTNKGMSSCAGCPLNLACPVSALVSPLREERPRGRDIPRPYIIYPPLGKARRYEPGERLIFGFSLFGNIIRLLPYIVLSVNVLEECGLGRKLKENNGRRGRFKILEIESYHSITGERQRIYGAGKPRVTVPMLSVTATDVTTKAATLSQERITLDFLTPTRIIEMDRPSEQASFRAVVLRLLERLSALEEAYGMQDERWKAESKYQLVKWAGAVTCLEDMRLWQEVRSYSNRQRRKMDISGFTGQVTFVGDLLPYRELLVWGEQVRVGKGAVKGNGWYKLAV